MFNTTTSHQNDDYHTNEQLHSDDDDFIDVRIRKPGKGKKLVVYLESDTDGGTDENQTSTITDTTKQNKRSARDILDDDTSTVEFYPNGTILIRPRPHHLPPGLGSLIVRHLSSQHDLHAFALVNKLCYSEANPLLWKEPKIQNETTLRLVITSLTDRRTSPIWKYFSWTAIVARRITNQSFQHVARHCPKLLTLRLSYFQATGQSLAPLAHHCPQLHHISFNFSPSFSPDVWIALASFPRLEILSITLDPVWQRNMDSLLDLTLLRHLTRLDISYASPGTKDSLLTAASTNVTWPHFTHLHIICSTGKNATFIQFMQSHSHIQDLKLGGSDINDIVLDAMAPALPHLTRVEFDMLYGISADGVLGLVRQAPQLTFVKLSSCGKLFDKDAPDYQYKMSRLIVLDQVKLDRIRSGVNEL
ncbi:unnamed protein product [Absidia cylindrospora]